MAEPPHRVTVRLRPHHLLCMLTYVGKGYSAAFVAHYDTVIGRLSAGEPIEIVTGPDEVCAPLLEECGAHCHCASVTERDRRAARDVGALLGHEIAPGMEIRLDARMLGDLREAFRTGAIRSACPACEWADLCSVVAASAYQGVRLQPSDPAA